MIELWEAAKRANLTEDELDSLKVTLLHHSFLDTSALPDLFLHKT